MAGSEVVAKDFGWRHAGRKDPVLQNVSFRIRPGERVLLLGESGSGKSTLLAALAGVLGDHDDGERAGEISIEPGPVGMVLQNPDSQVISSRVGDDIAFGCENLRVPKCEIWPRVEFALHAVGLGVPLDYPTARLSGGQKQRLALAGVLAMHAGLILLDEPTANLDPNGVEEVVHAVQQAITETGATLIVVEHRVAQWLDVIDRVIVLGDGGVVADGPPEILESLDLPGVWLPNTPMPKLERRQSDTKVLVAQDLITGYSSPIGEPRNLALRQGTSTVITGPNGVGKTTLALTLAGLLRPLGGTIKGFASPPYTWKSRELARRIGYVFQDPEHQFVARNVWEELQIGPKVMGVNADNRIEELLHRLRLEHLAQANPFTLSGGQKRRLSVATALVASPEVLILDEPTFGQDRRTFMELVQILRDLTEDGISICSISHDELFLQALGDYEVAL
ncbi:ABC transporter ATP-binding protein [Corynebacterium freiburgense]|uniref:ABC transporter ATP-binding protein n=1 Tax=Corynebacterium freiburgense TaxID=556548 RepID=UPI0004243A5F|nr:ATP-binding cassette domain-containing protein [Corynebacterium freiburgense]WJZ02247.1 Putative HMP/thiamine import ATP-binding protein YkoD [Corynebacterium freiburgense]